MEMHIDPMFWAILLVVAVILLWWWICSFVGRFARSKGRSYAGWTFFAMMTNPLLGLIIVAILGETTERRYQRIKEEAEIYTRASQRYANI